MQRIVVVGSGMVGHRFVEHMIDANDAGGSARFKIDVFGEEPELAYDRVNLSGFFDGKTRADLSLVEPGRYEQAGVVAYTGERATAIDRARRTVSSARRTLSYDKLVLATGSVPFVPPIPNCRAVGCFEYRTLADLDAIRDHAAHSKVGIVVGGGLLGLEAANALRHLGLRTHVIE